MKIFAIDFDGVCHDYKNPKPGRRMGPPIDGAEESINRLKRAGNKIIIHTVFCGDEREKKVVEDWLKFYGILFDEVTNRKPRADVYLDDHGMYFSGDWDETLEKLDG